MRLFTLELINYTVHSSLCNDLQEERALLSVLLCVALVLLL
jgi:hypothetical protein